MFNRMTDTLLRAFGWRSLLVHGDPCVLDRWLWLRRHARRGALRTFDAGCGNGAFSIYAARQGNAVLAASFSQQELDRARRRAGLLGVPGIQFRVLDLRELERQRAALGRFAQIFCLETAEHVRDDERLLRSLADMLEPGGRLLLTVPFDGHRPLYSEDPSPSGEEDGSHVRYGYTPQRLREITERAGLEIHAEDFISGVVSQKLTNVMRRLKQRLGTGAAWGIVAPLRVLVLADRGLTRLLGYPHLSVALVATKS